MEDTVSNRDLEDLLNPCKGYILRRGFLSRDAADNYRHENYVFLTTTKRVYKRIHRYAKNDYVWSNSGQVVPGDCTVLLSEPDKDYRGGALILYPREGRPVNIQESLGLRKGDALLFDKALYHEVEATEPAPGDGVGRWTAVIGGRYRRPLTVADWVSYLVWTSETATYHLQSWFGMRAVR